MLFKPTKLTDVLEFPQFPAEITAILKTKHGDGLGYEFHLSVDVDAAISMDALNLQVSVFKEKPTPAPMPKKVKSARSWGAATKKLEKAVKRQRQKRKDKRLSFRQVDLSNYFSNDLANLKNVSLNSSLSLLAPVTRSQKNSMAARSSIVSLPDPFTQNRSSVYSPQTPGILKPSGVKNKKGSNEPLSTTVIQGIKVTPIRSKSFSKVAISAKRDPASFSSSSKKLSSASPTLKMQVSSLVFTPPRSLMPAATFRVTPKKKKISFKMLIPRAKLANCTSFYVHLELENKKGVKVADTGTNIPHAMILNSFLTPTRAPALEAEYVKPGMVSLSVRTSPKDKMVKRVKVFRRKAPAEEAGTDSGSSWQEIFDADIEDSKEFRFRDSIATSRPLLYRAITYGENAKPSEKFASTIVLPLKQFRVKQSGALTATSSLTTQGANSFVDISVKDIPFDVITVMVRRFNVLKNSYSDKKASKGSGFVYVGSTPELQQVFTRDIDDDGRAEFRDESAKVGNNYTYVPVGITKTGKEIIGSSSNLQIPLSPNRAQVSLNVSSPRILRNSLIEMQLSAKFTDFGFGEIRKSLSTGQQANLFSTDLLEDRDKFESLINFLVERENIKTGEVESFGVYGSGKFTDDPATRQEKNIKELEPGVEYSYVVTALLNSPETLFPKLVRADIDTTSLLPFSRKVAKFQRPLALFGATLSSTARQADVTKPSALEPTDPLVAGRTNVQVRKDIRYPVSKSSKPKIRIEKHKRFNRIVWLSDTVDDVDHFRVYVVSSGGKVLVDTVHCDSSTSEFYYRHFHKDYAVSYQYLIQPIDLSYKELKPILTKTIKPVSMKQFLGIRSMKRVVRV